MLLCWTACVCHSREWIFIEKEFQSRSSKLEPLGNGVFSFHNNVEHQVERTV